MPNSIDIDNKVEFINVNSYEDILKLACQFNHVSFPIYSYKIQKKYRLIVLGERDKNLFIIYYYDTQKIPDYILYNPYVPENKMSTANGDALEINKYRIEIIPLKAPPFSQSNKNSNKIRKVEMDGHKSLIRMLILKSTAQEYVEPIYTFKKGDKRYLAAFNLFPDQKISSIFYSEYIGNINGFIRYNQKSGNMEMVDNINDPSSFHIKLISLAKPFSFI